MPGAEKVLSSSSEINNLFIWIIYKLADGRLQMLETWHSFWTKIGKKFKKLVLFSGSIFLFVEKYPNNIGF